MSSEGSGSVVRKNKRVKSRDKSTKDSIQKQIQTAKENKDKYMERWKKLHNSLDCSMKEISLLNIASAKLKRWFPEAIVTVISEYFQPSNQDEAIYSLTRKKFKLKPRKDTTVIIQFSYPDKVEVTYYPFNKSVEWQMGKFNIYGRNSLRDPSFDIHLEKALNEKQQWYRTTETFERLRFYLFSRRLEFSFCSGSRVKKPAKAVACM